MVDYYALIIATGSSTHSPLMGLIEDKKRLEASWYDFRKALKNAKSIVIAGGGPTGVETAGELGEYLNGRASFLQTNLKSPQVTVTIVTSSPQILPHLRTSIARKAEAYLAKIGVTVIKNVRVESVSPTGAGTGAALTTKARVTLGNGKILDADIYIPATGMRPNTSYIDPGLLTEDGLVDTDTTLRVGKAGPRVYAIGDVASCGRPGIPGIYNAVPVLGSNMKRDLFVAAGKDSDSLEKYRVFKDDTRESQLVPIGKSKGVGAVNGYQLPSFMVWLIKGRDYALWTGGGLWTGKNWAKET
jgi:NADH dehydrogenase FAD-containing subunit